MPAALAGVIVGLGVPDSELVVTTVALAVVVTLTVQATTKRWLARRLRLLDSAVLPPREPDVPPEAAPAGVSAP